MNTNNHPDIKNMPDEYKKKLVKYLFLCILSEGSKIFFFAAAALMLEIFHEFLFALVLIILLRTNGGGLHFKHYISCFLMSFSVLFGSIALGICLPFSRFVSCMLLLPCILLGYHFVPVVSSNRPPATDALIHKSKRITAFLLITYFLLICIVPMNQYMSIGIWIIMIHICQLVLAKILERRKNKC